MVGRERGMGEWRRKVRIEEVGKGGRKEGHKYYTWVAALTVACNGPSAEPLMPSSLRTPLSVCSSGGTSSIVSLYDRCILTGVLAP